MKMIPLVTLTLLAALAIASPPAEAAGTTAHLSWTPSLFYNDCIPVSPATTCNGTAIPLSDLKEYVVNWTGAFTGSLRVSAPATSTDIPVPCSAVTFTVQEVTTASAKYPSSTSDPSSALPYATGVTCKPNPPVGTVS